MERLNNNTTRTINLESGVANLGHGPLTIEMCKGSGWVTHDNNDVVIGMGEKIELKATSHPIVISAYCDNSEIIFKVSQPNSQNHVVENVIQAPVGLKTFIFGMLNSLATK